VSIPADLNDYLRAFGQELADRILQGGNDFCKEPMIRCHRYLANCYGSLTPPRLWQLWV
jgi:hypothetical protein